MENRQVIFDGKDIVFYTDNVPVVNGSPPEEIIISGDYTIDASSLVELIAAINKNVCGMTVSEPIVFHSEVYGTTCIRIFSKEKLPEKIEDALNIPNRMLNALEKDVQLLKEKIEAHNNLVWYKRIRKIGYTLHK